MSTTIMGVFRSQSEFVVAARRLHALGLGRLTAMSPIPLEALEEVLQPRKSIIRPFAMVGALFGMVFGFSIAVATALVFILPTGGRAIITVPPFLVISYEMTILFGVLGTLIGFFVASGLPARRDRPYLPVSNVDGFSLLVECDQREQLDDAQRLLIDSGAEEIHFPGEAT